MFDFNLSVFSWTLINFLILLVLVHKVAMPAFLKMVAESEERKQKALDELEQNNAESKRILDEYRLKLAQVEEEARQILTQAQRERDEIKKREMETMLKEKHDLLSGIRNEFDLEKRQFIKSMKKETVDLIILTTKTLMGRELSTSDHSKIVEENVQDFDTLLKR